MAADIVHAVPANAILFAIVGAVLLFGRRRWFARTMTEAERNDRRMRRRYRQRLAVLRSAGVSLLILAVIVYLTY